MQNYSLGGNSTYTPAFKDLYDDVTNLRNLSFL